MKITAVRGDINRQDVEAVVTAANTKLRSGGGVDGAVHAAAGPRLLQASLALAPCPPGGAVLTEAFDLAPVRWVIHAVGPIYQGPQDAATLTSAYTQALARADEVGATSVAFPSIHRRVRLPTGGGSGSVHAGAVRSGASRAERAAGRLQPEGAGALGAGSGRLTSPGGVPSDDERLRLRWGGLGDGESAPCLRCHPRCGSRPRCNASSMRSCECCQGPTSACCTWRPRRKPSSTRWTSATALFGTKPW